LLFLNGNISRQLIFILSPRRFHERKMHICKKQIEIIFILSTFQKI
jgi:hypothetical protein